MNRNRLRRTGAAMVALTGVATFSLAPAAHASHGGTANGGALNTANWRICAMSFGSDQFWPAMAHAETQLGRTDVITTSYVDCHSGDSNVSAYPVNSPETWLGLQTCLAFDGNGRCSLMSVQFNQRTLGTRAADWRMTACHEFGHVAGLGHRTPNSSCMTVGFSPPVVDTYDGHDIDAINATY